MKNKKGFTLIEVLIALSIVSFGLVALMYSNNRTLNEFNKTKEKVFASIILSNLAIEARLSSNNAIGIKDGEYKMAGKTWLYQYKTEKIKIFNTLKTTINLFANKAQKSNKKPFIETNIYLIPPKKPNDSKQ